MTTVYRRLYYLICILFLTVSCGESAPHDPLIKLQLVGVDIPYCSTTGGDIITVTGTVTVNMGNGYVPIGKITVGGIEATALPIRPEDGTDKIRIKLPPLPGMQGKKQTIRLENTLEIPGIGSFAELKDALTCYLGDISFRAALTSPILTGNKPSSIAVGDFNFDKDTNHFLDLAVTYDDNMKKDIDILIGAGDGSFTNNALLQVLAGNTSHPLIKTADFNQDKRDDLIFLDKTGPNLYVATQALGGFTPIPVSVEATALYLDVADIDGDSYPDIVTSNTDMTNQNRLSVLMNNQKTLMRPGFASPIKLMLLKEPGPIAIKDFNADNKPDLLVVSGDSSGEAYSFQQVAGVQFQLVKTFGVPVALTQTLLPIKTNQNLHDIVFVQTDAMSKFVTLVENTSKTDVSFSWLEGKIDLYKGSSDPISTAAVADINLDGFDDIVISTGDRLSVVLNQSRDPMNNAYPLSTALTFSAGVSLQGIAVLDFNSDGNVDIVGIPNTGTQLVVFTNTSR